MHRVSSSLTRGHGAGAALLTFIVSLPLRTFPTQRHASNAPPVMGSWRVEWWLDGGRTSGAHCGGGGAGGSFSAGVAQASLRVASRTERLWISARRLVCSPPHTSPSFQYSTMGGVYRLEVSSRPSPSGETASAANVVLLPPHASSPLSNGTEGGCEAAQERVYVREGWCGTVEGGGELE